MKSYCDWVELVEFWSYVWTDQVVLSLTLLYVLGKGKSYNLEVAFSEWNTDFLEGMLFSPGLYVYLYTWHLSSDTQFIYMSLFQYYICVLSSKLQVRLWYFME